MRTSFKGWLLRASVLAVAAGASAPGVAQEDLSGFKATNIEVVQLPRYCWASFDAKWAKPGMTAFNLPGGCGGRFNHFCPGVLSLQRAKSALADPNKRAYWLGVADGHIKYTVDGIKEYPACPLRANVDMLAQEIRNLRGR